MVLGIGNNKNKFKNYIKVCLNLDGLVKLYTFF